MNWKIPPINKVYEALGCIADDRIKINGNEAQVWSSDKSKSYTVKYDKDKNAIIANDNGSYWQGYLGYPSIAYLMMIGVIKYEKDTAIALKNIEWKKLNTKFKNNYNKTNAYALALAEERGYNRTEIEEEINGIYAQVCELDLNVLEPKIKPPKN